MALCGRLAGSPQERSNMDDTTLLANLLFSETKDLKDAEGIANVVLNRMKRPERFGVTLQDVVFAPYQFSGVNSGEWQKVTTGNLTKDEEKIYKQFLRISGLALKGKLSDSTNGADHYVNLKLSKPSWAKVYPQTVKIGSHTYFKEK
jgi:spore germination cell wall hydrolase CwlJ-like protein